jgi:hypothetical protein
MPSTGPISNGTSIAISSLTPNSSFYYTTNGTFPTTNSFLYSGSVVINGGVGVTLRAIGAASGFITSAITSASYALAQVATPVFSPVAGLITNGGNVSLSCVTTGATIYYTLNGSNPSTNSSIYSAPIVVTNPVTIKAQAYKPAWAPSAITTAFYGFQSFDSTVVTTVAGGVSSGFQNANGALASFYSPQGICIDSSNNFYIADTGNNVIRKMSATGEVTTFAGTGVAGSQDGPADQAQFTGPTGVCADQSGNVYVADSGNCYRVRRIDTNGLVTTIATLNECYRGPTMWQIEIDSGGILYVGSYGNIFKIFPDNSYTVFAGGGTGWAYKIGLGLDNATNIYAATQSKIWKVAPNGAATIFAGNSDPYAVYGYSDGPRLSALFQGPQDTVIDSATNVFVSDLTRIRKIRADGWISSSAGSGVAGYSNGRGSVAQFNNTAAICLDTNGNIYVADSGNNCIRKISPDTAGIGIADDWQRMNFGSVGVDPNDDPDHDGMSNLSEFWAGTNPLDATSVLALSGSSVLTNGLTQITWQSIAGKSYMVKYSSDLVTWSTLGSAVQGNGSILSVLDPNPIQQFGQRFYRVFLSSY